MVLSATFFLLLGAYSFPGPVNRGCNLLCTLVQDNDIENENSVVEEESKCESIDDISYYEDGRLRDLKNSSETLIVTDSTSASYDEDWPQEPAQQSMGVTPHDRSCSDSKANIGRIHPGFVSSFDHF